MVGTEKELRPLAGMGSRCPFPGVGQILLHSLGSVLLTESWGQLFLDWYLVMKENFISTS